MSVARLRKRARILMWLVTIPFAGFSLLTALLLANIVWQSGRYSDAVAIYYFPMFLYMWAIWMVRQALKAISEGGLFDGIVSELLRRVGIALFGGALFTTFGVPLLTRLRDGRPYFATFEPSPVTLGAVGITLVLFSQLLGRAASLRQELDEFF